MTNARFASLHGLPVALLPFDDARSTTQIRALVTSGNCIGRSSGGLPSAVGGGRCAPSAFHYAFLSVSAPLFPLADRRPKPHQNPLGIEVQIVLSLSQKLGSFCDS